MERDSRTGIQGTLARDTPGSSVPGRDSEGTASSGRKPQPFDDRAFAREAGRRGGIASAQARRRRNRWESVVEEELTDPETVRRIMRGSNDAAKIALIQMSASKRAAELARRERELDRRERESWNTDAALGDALDELATLRREIALGPMKRASGG